MSMEHAVHRDCKDCPRLSCKALCILIGKTKQRTIGEGATNKSAITNSLYTRRQANHRHDCWTAECLDLEINICRRHLTSIACCQRRASARLLRCQGRLHLSSVIEQCGPEISNKVTKHKGRDLTRPAAPSLSHAATQGSGASPDRSWLLGELVNGHRALTGGWSRPQLGPRARRNATGSSCERRRCEAVTQAHVERPGSWEAGVRHASWSIAV